MGAHPAHDLALFDALLGEARLRNPDIQRGSMFGAPALFLARRMIGCVFGSNIGLKVPAKVASQAIASRSATHFRPYGRKAMREWIEIEGPALTRHLPLLAQAIEFAGKEKADE